ncbi:MAG: hypothetical protein KGL39_19970 [Patescibacteria group bacterium]|nr:hypothetical protein [Patescibacteria group bacterium]
MIAKQDSLSKTNPFNEFICAGCGKRLGSHWIFRPEVFADVRPDGRGRKPNGKLYCHSDQTGWAGDYYQRELRRINVSGYDKFIGHIPRPSPYAGQEINYGRW